VTLRRATLAWALIAALLLAFAVPASAAKRTVPQSFFGVNWDGDIADPSLPEGFVQQQFATMAAAGVETLRTNFFWGHDQPSRGGPIDHASTDRIVIQAIAHGIDVLPVVIVAPAWARDNPAQPFSPPRDPRRYADYLTSLIQRYGPRGTFWAEHPELPKRPLRRWQIWNEPHLPFQWTVRTKVDWASTYGTLLRVAYRAAKKADPGSRIVLAGLANSSYQYLGDLYRRGRIKGNYDIAALHPYTATPQGVSTLIGRFRDVMRAGGDGRKPLWITELGLPASVGHTDGSNYLETDDKGMARFLQGAYARIVRSRTKARYDVDRVYWYTWASSYCCEQFRYTGLFQYDPSTAELTAKPAYAAYQRSARKYQGCTKTETGACRQAGDRRRVTPSAGRSG
jgi:hypothetical protein